MGFREDSFGSLRYGFSLYHAVKVEGIPFLFIEKAPEGTITATGYTVDATLMIDESAKIGSRIDERTGIGRAFELSFGLERSAATISLFKKPSNVTRLTADLTHSETTAIRVDSTTGFASSGAVYIGNERIAYTGKTGTQFQTLTRGTPATDFKGQSFDFESQVATWVTDAPMFWRGREVVLYAISVDPFGRVVSSDFADYYELWRGHVSAEPRPYPGGWSVSCKPLDRKLDQQVGISYSGRAVLRPEPDPKVRINPQASVYYVADKDAAAWSAGNQPSPSSFQPFSTLSASTYYKMSFLQGLMAMTWMAKVATDGVTTYWPASLPKFVQGGPFNGADKSSVMIPPDGKPSWHPWQTRQMFVRAKVENTGEAFTSATTFAGNVLDIGSPIVWGFSEFSFADNPSSMFEGWGGPGSGITQTGILDVTQIGDTNYHWIPTPIMFFYGSQLGALTITLDDEDPSNVPSSGYVVIEGNGEMFVIEYQNKEVENNELTVQTVNFKGNINDLLKTLGDENSNSISCRFCFIDSGQVVDTMRRMLYSSGRGNNDDGTFDTLPAGSGYDIRSIDDNFATELDGAWSDLSADFMIEEGVSFASVYGSCLALSQRAIVSRNVGTGMKLTCVSTSVTETAEFTFTLTDAHIIAAEGGSVRVSENPETPNRVVADLTRYKKEMGRVVVNDIVSQRADGVHPFDMQINGFNRDEIAPAIIGWSRSLFTARGGRLVYELDVVPWVECQVGDAIRIESSHFNFWDRSTGLRGYSGTARVLGQQIDLKSGKMVLYVAIAGAFQSYSLAPSAKLTSTNHTTNPTLLAIEGKFYALMMSYLAAEPGGFKLLVYSPGTDQTGDTVTVSAVTGTPSSTTYLTISAHSLSIPLVNGQTHLTVPFSATDSAVQAYHMHTDTAGAVWQ